jgi:hypothetical protein
VKYGDGVSEIEMHRQKALQAMEDIPYYVVYAPGRSLCLPDYFDVLLDSKSVLSPWGLGEAGHRDYEAMLSGAVLIKPHTHYVEGWPDIFRDQYYAPCCCDFADLKSIVAEIAGNDRRFDAMRRAAMTLAIEAGSEAAIAKRLANILEECGC